MYKVKMLLLLLKVMRNGLGVMADVTCHGDLLGMAQLSVSLGLSAALDIAVKTFTVFSFVVCLASYPYAF